MLEYSLMLESQRDAGLVRAIGPWGLAANIVNTVIGAGIFVVPAVLAAGLGRYAPLAFLVCGIVIAPIAICFAEGGSRIPTSGGAYGYIEAAYGPLIGYVAGTLLWLGDLLACAGIAAALADAAITILPFSWHAPAHAAVIVAVIGGVAWVNIGGVAMGTRLVDLATMVKLVPLAIFLLAGTRAIHMGNFAPLALTTHGLGRALILGFFLLTGMEGALCTSGEVEQPARTIPRALGGALFSVMLLYVAIQTTAQGILGAALANSAEPLVDAMARVHPALRALMLAGAALSMFGFISSDILSTPRVLFAFARDGLLPRILGRVHARTHAPYTAILCYAAIAAALALTGTFAELAVLSMLATAALYIGACAAAWRLARNGVEQAGAPLNFRWLGTAMVAGIASMILLIGLASRAEIIGLLVAVGGSAAIYLVQTRARLART